MQLRELHHHPVSLCMRLARLRCGGGEQKNVFVLTQQFMRPGADLGLARKPRPFEKYFDQARLPKEITARRGGPEATLQ